MKKLLVLFILLYSVVQAQVVTNVPLYPIPQDSLEIIFDATLGNGALAGVSPIYVHTGLITKTSMNPTDWKFRINPWPTGDPDLVIIDSIVQMEDIGNNKHRFKFKINNFFGTNTLVDYTAIALVFRNQDGTLAGKNADGTDIYIPVFKSGFSAKFVSPLTSPQLINLNENLDVKIITNEVSMINIFHQGNLIAQGYDSTLSISVPGVSYGKFWLRFVAQASGQTVEDSIYYIVEEPTFPVNPPFASQNGINYVNDSTVLLQLYAPGKSSAHVIGDFNNWQIDNSYKMNKTVDGTAFWIELTDLVPGQEYRFQYVVDQDVVIADPWADKYLSEYNDVDIQGFTYPNLIDYPTGKTNHMVSVFQTAQQPYDFEVDTFQRPWSQDLVIYELLIRDFLLHHDYKRLIDTLDYLDELGINAIELMPINEFDDNKSWGYSPAFYFAPDKYYGPKDDLKKFIDECHKRDIAVILDVVFNHSFSQNSMARLYKDKNSGKCTNDNPWFNSYVPHPFGFHHDFNHGSTETQYMVDRCLKYWIDEYNVDGYRFDLSKGFTQTYSYPSDLGLWGSYDPDRVYWLKRIYDQVRSYDSDCYLILEHFADNSEEMDLSAYGFMFWGNANHAYKEAAMGYQNGSDFSGTVSSKHKNWPYQHLVGFMESHDEERIMYECLEYGNMNIDGNGDTLYNTRDVATALKRVEAASAFFYTVPGPKMLWQFGELGYDFSINFNGRTAPKPLRWNYYDEPNRHYLYKAVGAMIDLKTQNTAFRTSNYDMDTWGLGKRMWVTDPSMSVTIIGNFDVDSLNGMAPGFQHTGDWYDYMTGDTITVTDVNSPIKLGAGDYHIFTDVVLALPDLSIPQPDTTENSVVEVTKAQSIETFAYPNPFTNEVLINYSVPQTSKVNVEIYDMLGNRVATLVNNERQIGKQQVKWNGANNSNGYYFYKVSAGNQNATGKLVLMK